MIGKILKVGFWTVVGLGTGIIGLGLLIALEDADYPLE
tara:strand:+ start:1876 stop:1989 length:114 start_codon:yes stop_codon:yes gene_type:complete